MIDENPTVAQFRVDLALGHMYLGNWLIVSGRLTDADAECRRALTLSQGLTSEDPKSITYRDCAANACNNLSVALRRLGRSAEARALCDRAVSLREALLRDRPD